MKQERPDSCTYPKPFCQPLQLLSLSLANHTAQTHRAFLLASKSVSLLILGRHTLHAHMSCTCCSIYSPPQCYCAALFLHKFTCCYRCLQTGSTGMSGSRVCIHVTSKRVCIHATGSAICTYAWTLTYVTVAVDPLHSQTQRHICGHTFLTVQASPCIAGSVRQARLFLLQLICSEG